MQSILLIIGDNMPEAVMELAKRLNGIAIISSDLQESDLEGTDIESVTAYIVNFFKDAPGPKILNKQMLGQIMQSHVQEAIIRTPAIQKPRPQNPIQPNFSIRNLEVRKTGAKVADFAEYFNNRLERLKSIIISGRNANFMELQKNVDSIKQLMNGREIGIIGMVYDKITTKNGHILATIEDGTGTAKVLFLKPSKESSKEQMRLFTEADRLIVDEVVGIRGRISNPFIMANALIRPDIPIKQRKRTEEDMAIAFMSDIHAGSKLFMEKQFRNFLKWINLSTKYNQETAEKVKYIVISGDLVDGIGVYPNQESELTIESIYRQYNFLFELFSEVPENIEIFMLPGNHDAMQRAEPQPSLAEEFLKDMKYKNIHMVSNPGYVTLEGIKILSYHGTSLDSVIHGIKGLSYSKPEGAMQEVLKRRHLSPVYGHNPIVPSSTDQMIMDQVPDILHMGHLHKNGSADYHGTLIVNSGTWQARTSYQIKLGHMPTPAVMPVYNTKSMELRNIDFNLMAD